MHRQNGQTMVEYLVVASALIGALFMVSNTDCPGYDNCLYKLKSVMHDKHEGYSHSISAVHQYGALKAEGFDSTWGEDNTSSSAGSGGGTGGGGEVPSQVGVARTDQVVSPNGNSTYGTLVSGQYVTDANGDVIGTYDGSTGTVTFTDDSQTSALVASVITDENGDRVDLEAVVDCGTDEVYGFGYRSGVTGDFFNSLTLDQLDTGTLCTVPTYAVTDVDGNPLTGAIVGDSYYASTFTNTLDTVQVPSGEVVKFDIVVPDEPTYSSSSPGIGAYLVDCAVLGLGWDSDAGVERLDAYLNGIPSARIGSLVSGAGIPCPAAKVVD